MLLFNNALRYDSQMLNAYRKIQLASSNTQQERERDSSTNAREMVISDEPTPSDERAHCKNVLIEAASQFFVFVVGIMGRLVK